MNNVESQSEKGQHSLVSVIIHLNINKSRKMPNKIIPNKQKKNIYVINVLDYYVENGVPFQ